MLNKKILIILSIFILGIVFGVAAAQSTNYFNDVPKDHFAFNAVNELFELGGIKGYADGEFKGDRNITRYEAAVMICRAIKIAEGKSTSPCEQTVTAQPQNNNPDVSFEDKICQTNEITLLDAISTESVIDNINTDYLPENYLEQINENPDSTYNQGYFVLNDCLQEGDPAKVTIIGHVTDIFGDFVVKAYAGSEQIKNGEGKLFNSKARQIQFRNATTDEILDWQDDALNFPGLNNGAAEYYASVNGDLVLESSIKQNLITGEIILVLAVADSEGNISQRYAGKIHAFGEHNWQ